MNFLDDITDFKLIVATNKNIVTDYISKKNYLVNYKVISINEFRKKYYFDYKKEAIYFLMKKLNIKYDIAKSYLEDMIYLTKEDYKHKKLKLLKEYKDLVNNEGYLLYDDYFKEYLKGKDIIVIENNLSKFDKFMFDEVSKSSSVSYQSFLNPIYEHVSLHFDTMEDEVDFVAHSISKLINEGVSIEKIKLTNVSSDYINTIKRVFSFYNLKMDYDNNTPLYSTNVCKEFLENLTSDKEKSLKNIDKYKNTNAYNQIFNILNDFYYVDNLLEIKPYLIEEMKRKSIPKKKINNSIEVVDYRNYYFTDEYVFMLNFNNGSIPIIKKDEDYINDDIKSEVNLDLTVEVNSKEKQNVVNIIKSIKNLTITFKDKSSFESFYPSNLTEEFPIKEGSYDITQSYSSLKDKIKLAFLIENLIKYGTNKEQLSVLYGNYKIDFNSYDHRYKPIDKNILKEYLNNKLRLSYSSMDNYNKCAFKYYISNILCLDIYEETFGVYIGKLFHDVLQKCLINNIDVQEEIDEFIKTNKREFTKKEEFYIKKTRTDLENVVEHIKESLKYTDLKDFMFEKKIEVIKSRDLNVTFSGVIDKIMYKQEEDKVIMCLIDYKTYKTIIDLNYLDVGLYMQLPVYLYLARNMEIKNIVFAGFYLQQILSNSLDKQSNSLKLEGYTNSDKDIVQILDKSYADSKFIKSLRIKNDGNFYAYSKVISNDEIDEVIEKTDKIIDNVIDNIASANFVINPKKIDNKNLSCEFCKFKDICFMNEKDMVSLNIKKGSDDNA